MRKFKALCENGRNASLSSSANAGKASKNLCVGLGVLQQQHLQHHQHHSPKHSRNGPAEGIHRKRQAAARIAAARIAAAEEADSVLSPEELEVYEMAENAKSDEVAKQDISSAKAKIAEEEITPCVHG